ncbi:von Willebrand factor C domain-containing protein 2-like [Bulinus truncatus]|nr:von Willebrand factor C domain-containing protein 2-like [Bulinus truncatus]
MKKSVCLGLFVAFCILASSTVVSRLARPRGCLYNKKIYMIGAEFKPSDCEFCRCSEDGNVACAIMDCARPQCPNPVKLKGQCCPVCPREYLPLDKELAA